MEEVRRPGKDKVKAKVEAREDVEAVPL